MNYLPGLKAILDNSGTLVNWALAVAAGSVAALIGTSYQQPKTRRWRPIYLAFPMAWAFLGRSVFWGEQISRRFIAAQLGKPVALPKILGLMQSDFLHQWSMLMRGLALLAVWLLLFVGIRLLRRMVDNRDEGFWGPRSDPGRGCLPQRRSG
jgi:hypothetical protein